MKLRNLEQKDAIFMLEWMHDYEVVKDLQTNFTSKTINDCEEFISTSRSFSNNIHMAIVDETDTYMGTVSLKNIHRETAEFAITIRKCAMGKGFSEFGMKQIIQIGFNNYQLKQIYWCVSPDNHRAVKFYDKNGYKRIDFNKLHIKCTYSEDQIKKFIWYAVTKDTKFINR